ncbi:MAG: gfo/Idh/MocA family oxidoreductase, partial [Rhodobacteraceae bacterium]|nr:gfo/Idh/MocA family oxidoreductase [Paracoccaceae bacterium]
ENKIGLEKLRVGVLGMGFMGGTHTQAWQRGKATFNWPIDVELVALFDTDEDTRDLHANRFDFQRVTGDWREVCEADDIDVVSICTPNFTHWEMAEAAAKSGKHIWCEKPMATSMADARAMVSVAQEYPDSSTGEMRQVETDDQFSALGTFESGALFTMHTSWLGQGHKMNLGFEITGTKGAIKFDQERMGEFQLFEMDGNSEMSTNGYKTVLIGPYHPFFGNFCPAPGHHVGFNEMKIIEVGAFVKAILEDDHAYPNFKDGLLFETAIQAIQDSSDEGRWITL